MSATQQSCYELKDSNRVGRSLFASRSIPFGTHILSDNNILLKFNAEDLTPLSTLLSSENNNPEIAKNFIAEYNSLPALALSAVAIINKTADELLLLLQNKDDENRNSNNNLQRIWKHIKEMHAPQLPISEDTFLLTESCRILLEKKEEEFASKNTKNTKSLTHEIARLWNQTNTNEDIEESDESPNKNRIKNKATAVSAILHTVMALKTNAHRASDNDWCLFPLASKLAHSCDPNCFFIPPSSNNNFTASFVSMKKEIKKGEVLSFSYLGGPALTLSTHQRRLKLQRSHLFVCNCERCQETEDFGSGVVLSSSSSSSTSGSGNEGHFVRLSCPLGLPEADFESSKNKTNDRKHLWRRIDGGNATSFLSDQQVHQDENYKQFVDEESSFDPQIVYGEKKKLRYNTIASSLASLTSSSCPSLFCFSDRRLFLAHPLVVESCRQAVLYFTTMCQLSVKAMNSGLVAQKNKPKVSAFQLLFCWTLKYFSCLEAIGILGSDTTLEDPPHMLVVQTAVSLIDLCLQYPPSSSNNNNNNDAEIILVQDATPGTGILAVLAQHCRGMLKATITTSSNNQQEKKLAKFDVLCELETDTFDQIKSLDLMQCLELSCAEESWKMMAFPQQVKKQGYAVEKEFRSLLNAWSL